MSKDDFKLTPYPKKEPFDFDTWFNSQAHQFIIDEPPWYAKLGHKFNSFIWEIKDIFIGLKSVISWWPIIYKDRPWNDHPFEDMILHRLNIIEKYYSNRDSGLLFISEKERKKILKQIKKVKAAFLGFTTYDWAFSSPVLDKKQIDNFKLKEKELVARRLHAFNLLAKYYVNWWD